MTQWINVQINRTFSKEEIQMAKTHEEMLNIPCHKGNTSQNYIKITFYSC
jgi:hypothetical protein